MSEEPDAGQTSASPKEMAMGMAKKMMSQMAKGRPSPMAMMQKTMAQMGQG